MSGRIHQKLHIDASHGPGPHMIGLLVAISSCPISLTEAGD
jgi:hypothetical protein